MSDEKKSPATPVPGLALFHGVITKSCVQTHGGAVEAMDEAYRRLMKEFEHCLASWEKHGKKPGEFGDFRLVLTLERDYGTK